MGRDESKLPEAIWITDTPDRHWYEYECTCTEKYVRSDIADAEITDLNKRIVSWIETAEAHAKAATKAESERDLLARAWVLLDDFNYDVPPISENFEQVQTGLELASRIVRGE